MQLVDWVGFNVKLKDIAIASEGIEAVCEKLKSGGVVFETKEIGYAANVLENGCKGIFFRGPDDERIEIVEPGS
jgi:catechol 2,3-dioxygenase-like lactoylglutathione lyase family enzyme